ncbi:DHH family phosphoesterase [Alteribacillus iranensis]|uniref:Phosphoesterase RecJ domain-containing protein n=1 Tax=Alteribacillus iranensis TaxID=930128 RepID=A0A1I2CIQ4_9BACI|nr:bifunctional oligoribonuclease/PAP phosphatase NrnA [Alteribacillus iranensis]SFE68196.1 phosphoesterase RecJ domain-containing protein [Alteribacillus iranensis]
MMHEKILEQINNYQTIYIYRHEKPDPDAIGSQVGLAALLQHNYPDKAIILKGEEEPSLAFLTESVVGEQEGDDINRSLVVICDTANTERIDGEEWEKGDQVIKIDHHPETDTFGDLSWVETEASSTSEMIIELGTVASDKFGWEWTQEAARLLYAGIVGDTGRFQHSNTTPKTLRSAANMLQYGFDTTELFTSLYENSESLIRLKGKVLQEFVLTENGLGIMYLTRNMLEEHDVTVAESAALINAFSNTEGLKAWVFFVEEEEGTYRVRLRSKKAVVNGIAANHRGGGHPLAAGAKAKDKQETEAIIDELEKVCKTV